MTVGDYWTGLQGVAEAECRRAADAAEAAYNEAFNKSVASELEALNDEHQRCMSLARQAYAEGAIGLLPPHPPSIQSSLSIDTSTSANIVEVSGNSRQGDIQRSI
jgi:hypothetical protein